MHIVLTHEQADFDALASLLAAHLLDETRMAVLPRRLNRNCSAFLNLYGEELPFTESRDLPDETIETITLVDTQSLITLKGYSPSTRVHTIDHHPRRPDLPENWSYAGQPMGACTTLLVEEMMQRDGHLTTLHSTLLLLGIYEDTGSLTYSSTTPRDIRAAADLLEHGADLNIVSKFLNPALTDEQRNLYDILLSTATTHIIKAQKIIIARAIATNMSDEISSVAHKLREFLDLDALFLMVATSDGIRLVARSTTERINVAAILSRFGGGGHTRAASALIKYKQRGHYKHDLEQVQKLLESELPKMVLPPITVEQIMSRRPHLLTPGMNVNEAATLMQRLGYEGFPVVDSGRVIGLLTRRAVDRAISHKLNLTVQSLMEEGEITISPEDSLEELQVLMTSSGWGQVPVVDPSNQKIIGIVTRTDLIKMLIRDQATIPGRQNISSRLESALPPARIALLKAIGNKAHIQHLAAYVVGGFVRDLLLDRPSLDFDVVVEGDAISLAHLLKDEYGGRLVSHKRFGTAVWEIGNVRKNMISMLNLPEDTKPDTLPESLDIISARTEFYEHPTALPTVERGSIKLDLHRRDFTINTLALRLDGRHYGDLYDYWGGENDLHRGLVRVLHSLSFVDDPTRMLRAVRFEQRFGFQIEARTLQLMSEAHLLLKQLSGDRLRHELNLILDEKNAPEMLARLQELGLLESIHPDLTWDQVKSEKLRLIYTEALDPKWDLPPTHNEVPIRRFLAYTIWLATLSENSIKDISKRLHFSRYLANNLVVASLLLQELPLLCERRPSQIVARFHGVPMFVLYALNLLSQSGAIKKMLWEYVTAWRNVQPETTGKVLREMGVEVGPLYRRVLTELRTAWLDGIITNPNEEKCLLEKLIKQKP